MPCHRSLSPSALFLSAHCSPLFRIAYRQIVCSERQIRRAVEPQNKSQTVCSERQIRRALFCSVSLNVNFAHLCKCVCATFELALRSRCRRSRRERLFVCSKCQLLKVVTSSYFGSARSALRGCRFPPPKPPTFRPPPQFWVPAQKPHGAYLVAPSVVIMKN